MKRCGSATCGVCREVLASQMQSLDIKSANGQGLGYFCTFAARSRTESAVRLVSAAVLAAAGSAKYWQVFVA